MEEIIVEKNEKIKLLEEKNYQMEIKEHNLMKQLDGSTNKNTDQDRRVLELQKEISKLLKANVRFLIF